MAGKPGTAGMKNVLSPPYAMELKNAHVEVASATRLAVIEGKCPSCYRGIHRPLDSFKRLGYLCDCGTTVVSPDDLDTLLASAIKIANRCR